MQFAEMMWPEVKARFEALGAPRVSWWRRIPGFTWLKSESD